MDFPRKISFEGSTNDERRQTSDVKRCVSFFSAFVNFPTHFLDRSYPISTAAIQSNLLTIQLSLDVSSVAYFSGSRGFPRNCLSTHYTNPSWSTKSSAFEHPLIIIFQSKLHHLKPFSFFASSLSINWIKTVVGEKRGAVDNWWKFVIGSCLNWRRVLRNGMNEGDKRIRLARFLRKLSQGDWKCEEKIELVKLVPVSKRFLILIPWSALLHQFV